VFLAYLDESEGHSGYYVGALTVHETASISLVHDLDDVAEEACLSHAGLPIRPELHGYDIWNGLRDWASLKGNYREQIYVYERAIDAIAAHDVVFYSRGVNTVHFETKYGKDRKKKHNASLAWTLERVQWRAEREGETVLAIADESEHQNFYRNSIRDFQEYGTFGWRDQKLSRIVDALHFAPSKASRLLQAADLVTYLNTKRLQRSQDKRALAVVDRLWTKLEDNGRIGEVSCWP